MVLKVFCANPCQDALCIDSLERRFGRPVSVTLARPHLRWLSEDAVVLSYTRLTQKLHNEEPITARCCETRIWQRSEGLWKQVHVHRS